MHLTPDSHPLILSPSPHPAPSHHIHPPHTHTNKPLSFQQLAQPPCVKEISELLLIQWSGVGVAESPEGSFSSVKRHKCLTLSSWGATGPEEIALGEGERGADM